MSISHRAVTAVALMTLAIASGCGSTEPPSTGPRDVLALIINGTLQSEVLVPDTVSVGAPFTVSFTSIGGGCTTATPRVDVHVSGLSADVRGYDHVSGSDICTQNIVMLPHSATLSFTQRGTATVHIIGNARLDGNPAIAVGELDRTVVVQ